MTPDELLARYHALETKTLPNGRHYTVKRGLRGYPLHPGVALILARADLRAETLLDASGSGGLVALVAEAEEKVVLEPSKTALRCASATFAAAPFSGDAKVTVAAGAPWDAGAGNFDLAVLAPPTDRGSARVQAELVGAKQALRQGGRALIVMHKDQGAKRYEKLAADLFGDLTVEARDGGWRLICATKTHADVAPQETTPFKAAGLTLRAEPGVFAAGKLDPGSSRLLDAVPLEAFGGAHLLDLGCGYGLLALKASLAGAEVTALDDDLLAVRSTHDNARRYGADVRVLHSDVDSELQDEHFDTILMNPPFHVGKQVVMDVPKAFLAAAHTRLREGGTLILVANRALPYERDLMSFTSWETLAQDAQFKVLRAVR